MIQHRTGTLGHAVQRVFRNVYVDAGLALDQLIQTAQQCAAAGQGDGRPSTRLRPLISMVISGSSA